MDHILDHIYIYINTIIQCKYLSLQPRRHSRRLHVWTWHAYGIGSVRVTGGPSKRGTSGRVLKSAASSTPVFRSLRRVFGFNIPRFWSNHPKRYGLSSPNKFFFCFNDFNGLNPKGTMVSLRIFTPRPAGTPPSFQGRGLERLERLERLGASSAGLPLTP